MKFSTIKRFSIILAIITLFSSLAGCADNNNASNKYNPTDNYDSSDKNDDSAEYDFSGINYFSYRYCSGLANHLGVSFKLELKDEVYTATVKPKDELFSKSKEFIVDEAFVEELTKLLEKNNVQDWNGFDKKNDHNIADGNWFNLEIKTNNEDTVIAKGYMGTPANHDKVAEQLEELFMSLYSTTDKN